MLNVNHKHTAISGNMIGFSGTPKALFLYHLNQIVSELKGTMGDHIPSDLMGNGILPVLAIGLSRLDPRMAALVVVAGEAIQVSSLLVDSNRGVGEKVNALGKMSSPIANLVLANLGIASLLGCLSIGYHISAFRTELQNANRPDGDSFRYTSGMRLGLRAATLIASVTGSPVSTELLSVLKMLPEQQPTGRSSVAVMPLLPRTPTWWVGVMAAASLPVALAQVMNNLTGCSSPNVLPEYSNLDNANRGIDMLFNVSQATLEGGFDTTLLAHYNNTLLYLPSDRGLQDILCPQYSDPTIRSYMFLNEIYYSISSKMTHSRRIDLRSSYLNALYTPSEATFSQFYASVVGGLGILTTVNPTTRPTGNPSRFPSPAPSPIQRTPSCVPTVVVTTNSPVSAPVTSPVTNAPTNSWTQNAADCRLRIDIAKLYGCGDHSGFEERLQDYNNLGCTSILAQDMICETSDRDLTSGSAIRVSARGTVGETVDSKVDPVESELIDTASIARYGCGLGTTAVIVLGTAFGLATAHASHSYAMNRLAQCALEKVDEADVKRIQKYAGISKISGFEGGRPEAINLESFVQNGDTNHVHNTVEQISEKLATKIRGYTSLGFDSRSLGAARTTVLALLVLADKALRTQEFDAQSGSNTEILLKMVSEAEEKVTISWWRSPNLSEAFLSLNTPSTDKSSVKDSINSSNGVETSV